MSLLFREMEMNGLVGRIVVHALRQLSPCLPMCGCNKVQHDRKVPKVRDSDGVRTPPLATPLVLGGVDDSLRPVEETESIPDGKLACGCAGLTAVVARVRLDPVF